MNQLRDAGQDLSREKLLDMVIAAESDLQIEVFASMARPVMDYQFFQALSEKIDAVEGDEKEKLSGLRESLLEVTGKIDQQMHDRIEMSRKNVDILMNVEEEHSYNFV